MQYRPLGRTNINVSVITLGTMTWGEQNTEAEAHSQLDLAVERGINLIDVAEMYPVPPKPETQGLSERYLGTWLKKSGKRDQLLIATKATGPARKPHNPRHIRGGINHFDRKGLSDALHGSLDRLQLDYVDLYQLHWPDRSVNSFGQLNYNHIDNEETVAIEETLRVLSEFVKAGKIRHIGLSNETSWGVAQFLRAAEKFDLERVVTIQNPYNLLNRLFEINLAEFAHREQVGLLAYSPLAFGVLSGKYLNGARPVAGRLTLFDRFVRYSNPQVEAATAAYVALARKYQIDPAQLALAYVNSRPFVTSNIIGATTLEQLRSNIDSVSVEITPEIIDGIEAIHKTQPNPAP
ncbi:aryl-alcohol dehydrogenase-like predicted oxidoreductase [Herbaspirillum sp. Sphag1AN]|uniref:NADP(H)-dependent aldo-keto reductase n=1 Tax=unclassified Herbaspirillum TaxID=2624150 RepID=UPI0016162A13|nr:MULTISPECIES: NADP(H)-dependent aldo-keto reductase [unclassified Herbaspirillum]MBB3213100.1 aryl-alcohol dehydrogenase-like predicted oxidoreductase [Herbaspirillum sp. Sphag1AN]MBB3246297.1 aryl-alcohol dehydrogenase-like predicted oxidoreductase [Herbaspirillum sp. Sphag64]